MRLAILGTGSWARSHAINFSAIEGVEIVGCADTDRAQLAVFAKTHQIPKKFSSADALLDWGKFDAVVNVTPDRAHYATTMALLREGKHIFCEKPLAENYRQASEMASAAETAGLINMVNLTYRNSAALQKARSMVLAGEIGEVKHVEASYLQSWLVSKAWGDWQTEPRWLWRLSKDHGSNGVLGDVGIHILDLAGYGAGSDIKNAWSQLKTFKKAPDDRIGEYRLDANDSFVMSVEFENGALGVVHASRWATGHLNDLRLRLFGDRGGLVVHVSSTSTRLEACLGDDIENGLWREVEIETTPINAQRFVDAVRTGVNGDPSFRHAADLQRLLDQALVAEGLTVSKEEMISAG
jgi:predicted dehydrogenase